ncbi:MAG: sugar ABC transporter ATP-binding protein [Erysipelotrichaceae bacterium]|nr:sugar ABC transporter ATP-binding protein [Erysipelotrichaceae bacterium]
MSEYLLEMKGICKSFPGVKALDHVNLNLHPHSVHALMGENGAGKSTLMKCLFGIYKKDEGTIIYEGEEVNINNPLDALQRGIAIVNQELQPVPERSIAENIYIGRYPTKKIGPISVVDHKAMREGAKRVLDDLGIDFDVDAKLGSLTISQQQLVEICKACVYDAKIIILDEPTSSLTSQEVSKLFEIINKLRDKGCGIIYISHKMDEILKISDEVTIMRDGQYVGTWPTEGLTIDFIIKNEVGREMTNMYPPKTNTPGEVVLKVENYTSPFAYSFKDCSFELKRGEILGVAGLVGAQRTELMEAIYGLRSKTSGKLTLNGEEISIEKPIDAMNNGFALLTEDRRGSGIFGVLSIKDNVSIASLSDYLKYRFVLNGKAINEVVEKSIASLSIKCPSSKELIQNLSGGNQQKVIISRWLAKEPDILIMDEPTRGIDVGAKYEIYSIISRLANEGKCIIMISSEMPELIGVANRIMVMCEGKISGFVEGDDMNQEKIMDLATKFMQGGLDDEK